MARPTVSVAAPWASTRSGLANSDSMPWASSAARNAAACGVRMRTTGREPGELGQRGVGDQPPGDQHDDLVDGLGHFGQQMAGDQHGATGGGVAAHEVA